MNEDGTHASTVWINCKHSCYYVMDKSLNVVNANLKKRRLLHAKNNTNL